MPLIPPTGIRSQSPVSAPPDVDTAPPPPPVSPRPSPPASRDAMETTDQARLQAAAAAIGTQGTPQQRGVQAARTLDEVRSGSETRNSRVYSANREVAKLETRLGQQLQHLSPAMTPQDRQRYADAYRAQHSGAYREAREAATDLATYARDAAPRIAEATQN